MEKLLTEQDINRISKQDLINFFNLDSTLSKKEIIQIVLERIKDSSKRKLLLDKYTYELGLLPKEVEEILGCTKTERLRFTKDDKLGAQMSYQPKGVSYMVIPIYSRLVIENITDDIINQWRQEYNALKTKNRQMAIRQRIENRKINDKLRKNNIDMLGQMFQEWSNQVDNVTFSVLKLAFWTSWINRFAKNHQHGRIVTEKTQYFYALKDKALQLMYHSNRTKLSFYQPENPHKIIWGNEYGEIKQKINNYYSLYYMEFIVPNELAFKCSFHIPYTLGKKYLPSYKELPKVEHLENEGSYFRFGRKMTNEEKILFKETYVEKQFNECYNNLQKILMGDN